MQTISRTLTGLVAAGMMMLTASATSAQQNCGARDKTLGKLKTQYSEHVLGRGLSQKGKSMFELLVSKSGSWTVLASDPKGRSCIVAGGDS
jgi:hypothetical protein